MSQLADHLAQLTGFRDRDVMDTTLVTAIRDLLRPRRVAWQFFCDLAAREGVRIRA